LSYASSNAVGRATGGLAQSIAISECGNEFMKYVLITPAHNEERFIEATLISVMGQSKLPERYVVVDDGSTDRTAEIVSRYSESRPWMTLVRLPTRSERHFAGKVRAFNAGMDHVKGLAFEVIGNLDADVSLEPDHCEYLLRQFANDPKLGVGGTIYTQPGFDSTVDSFEGEECVAGPLQLFRRQCFEDIGGYNPNPLGGVDWIAVTSARMRGWRTRAFTERRFHHHRSMGTANRSAVGAMFDYGRKDYFLGGSALWQLGRVGYRMAKRPFIFGGIALLCGYLWAALSGMPLAVDDRLAKFHRQEQRRKLYAIVAALVTFQRVDKFRLGRPES
jgi:glycosyltransferase involved in cell wall biosynthesis